MRGKNQVDTAEFVQTGKFSTPRVFFLQPVFYGFNGNTLDDVFKLRFFNTDMTPQIASYIIRALVMTGVMILCTALISYELI